MALGEVVAGTKIPQFFKRKPSIHRTSPGLNPIPASDRACRLWANLYVPCFVFEVFDRDGNPLPDIDLFPSLGRSNQFAKLLVGSEGSS